MPDALPHHHPGMEILMEQTRLSKYMSQTVLIIAGTIVVTLLGLSIITCYDNKYIAKAALIQDNFTQIPEKGCYSLVDGWDLYPDVLLSPEDFASPSLQSRAVYPAWIGEYPNLSSFHQDNNPYGIATWRLNLRGNGTVTLYLPESLCAVKVFADDLCLGQTGDVSPENYVPRIRDSFFSFSLEGETDLIIQTANYSHYYGGIWYVPLIGDPDSISHLAAARMLLYGLLCAVSFTLSLFCMVLWKTRVSASDRMTFYFGMASLAFALRICYPFFRMIGVPLVRSLYAIEDAASLAGIYFTLRIILLLFLPDSFRRMKAMLRTLSLCALCMVIVVPMLVLPAIPGLVPLYGLIVSWYKLLMGGLFISLTIYGIITGRSYTKTLLASAVANGICLLYSVLSIGYYEPLVGAYPEEYGAFSMVIAFAILMVRRNAAILEENRNLNMHLQEEVREKTQHLQKLLEERGELISELGHDMKSPLTSLSNMAQIIRLNDIMLDADTRERMIHIEEQCDILSKRLKSIQEIAAQTSCSTPMQPVLLNTFLSDFCHSCRPVIELNGTNFIERITPEPCRIMASHEQLFRALENVLYNASDFTPADGEIVLSLDMDESFAYIGIFDTGCGIAEENLPNIFHRSYTTRADEGGQGLGLAITRAIILEHGGQITVESTEGEGTAFTISLPLIS